MRFDHMTANRAAAQDLEEERMWQVHRTLPRTCSPDKGASLLSLLELTGVPERACISAPPQCSASALHMEGSQHLTEQRGGPQGNMGGDDNLVMK